ncbi:hypothetical protein [Flavobacterium sp. HNIBRBA15423]|uniref:hypothetical protein n=1 Tax=Flavobacterium sp. HNIBRBA15423 TaxID=3458683 RepID=UPI004044751C
MKKLLFAAVAVFAFGAANAQEGGFKAGIHAGLPMGDIKDAYSLNLGLDVAYLWNVGEGFDVGATTGYSTYLGKTETIDYGFGSLEVEYENMSFIPVAATAQYSLSEMLFIGADLGYAIGVSEDNDGGFLYQPKFGYQAEKFEAYLGYKGISMDGGTASSLNVGFAYKF